MSHFTSSIKNLLLLRSPTSNEGEHRGMKNGKGPDTESEEPKEANAAAAALAAAAAAAAAGSDNEQGEKDEKMGDETQLPYLLDYQKTLSQQSIVDGEAAESLNRALRTLESSQPEPEQVEDPEGRAGKEEESRTTQQSSTMRPTGRTRAGAGRKKNKAEKKPPPPPPSPSFSEPPMDNDKDNGGTRKPPAAAVARQRRPPPPCHMAPPRPDLAGIHADVTDWICHLCLMQSDPSLAKDDAKALESHLSVRIHYPTGAQAHQLLPSQRMRLQLAFFYARLCGAVATDPDGQGDGEPTSDADQDNSMQKNNADDEEGRDARIWEELDAAYGGLIASMQKYVAEYGTASESGSSSEDAKEDQGASKAVFALIKVQHALAGLASDMDNILQERPVRVRTEAEDALDSYFQKLENVYGDDDASADGLIPPALVAVCRPEDVPESSSGVSDVIRHVREIESTGEFSRSVLAQKVQNYFVDWSSRHLVAPALVRLGYKGVTTLAAAAKTAGPSCEDDILAGDMSSFGDDIDSDQDLLTADDGDVNTNRRSRVRSGSAGSKASLPRNRAGSTRSASASEPQKQGGRTTTKELRRLERHSYKPPPANSNARMSLERTDKQPADNGEDESRSGSETEDDLAQLKNHAPVVARAAPKAYGIHRLRRPPSPPAGTDSAADDEDDRPHTQLLAQTGATEHYGEEEDDDGDGHNSSSNTTKAEPDEDFDPDDETQDSRDEDLLVADDKEQLKREEQFSSLRNGRSGKRLMGSDDSFEEENLSRRPRRRPRMKKCRNHESRASRNASDDDEDYVVEEDDDDTDSDPRIVHPDIRRDELPRPELSQAGHRAPLIFSSSRGEQLSFDSGSEDERPNVRQANAVTSPLAGRTKRFFTADEEQAIREGFRKYGSNWQTIKANSNGRLMSRTAGQIKDKVRTMRQQGNLYM